MTERKKIEDTLSQFVVSELLDGDAGDLTPTTNLLALGVIDSLAVVSIQVFMERTFEVRLPGGIQPEDFATISSMATMIERLQREAAEKSKSS